MNSDAILLGMADEEFRQEIDEALKACRSFKKGDPRPAKAAQWAQTSLAADMIVLAQEAGVEPQAKALLRLMQWAVEVKFGKENEADSAELRQRRYASVYYPYFKDEPFQALATRLGLDATVLYDNRKLAIDELAAFFRAELQTPQHQAARHSFAITQPIQELPEPQRRILSFLAVFEQPLPLVKLKQIVQKARIAPRPESAITHLINAALVQTDVTQGLIWVVDQLRTPLDLLTDATDLSRFHKFAAQHALESGEYLVAARHWGKADEPDRAVEELLKRYEQIVNAGQIGDLYTLLGQLHQAALKPQLWAQLKLLLGRAALMVDDQEAAIRELNAAFSTEDLEDLDVKVQACYYLAKTYEKANFWNALAQFDRGIELIEASSSSQGERTADLLADLYIGKAWLFIQMQPDLEQATKYLSNAQKLIQKEDASRLTAFHAAQAALEFARKQQLESEIRDRYKALVAAEESGDQEAICKACFNLVQAYRYANYFQEARPYLARAYSLAKKLKDSEKQGRCLQEYGAIAFGEEAYAEAVEHHQQAYAIYKRKKLETFTCAVCYDLAETYAKLCHWEQAKRFYKEALEIAERGNPMLRHELTILATNYPKLVDDLNERQTRALEYINQYGEISKGRYQEVTGAPNSTALRALTKMVEMGLLKQIGKGPKTRYVRADNPATS